MQTLVPNDGPGLKMALWAPTTITLTAPVGTWSATSGADSQPGLTLSGTGTSGTIEAVASIGVSQETALLVSCICTASSATPTLVPIQVTWKDASGNTIVTVTPYASAAAPTSATQYNAVVAVPDGAKTATVTLAALSFTATGGYSVIMQTPIVAGF
jgi:hypothetical protein